MYKLLLKHYNDWNNQMLTMHIETAYSSPDATRKIKRLTKRVILPTHSTSQSVGIDLYYSGQAFVLKPNQIQTLDMDIIIEPPENTYGPISHKVVLHININSMS